MYSGQSYLMTAENVVVRRKGKRCAGCDNLANSVESHVDSDHRCISVTLKKSGCEAVEAPTRGLEHHPSRDDRDGKLAPSGRA
ncbi:hypothetical protein E2C01_018201 [Portunus trituberculatus]|uniref:Uncharacterized protein n=1 Tax=Portunus trituberculatus TaxID=210409 RepID=A0A5B7DTW9_PORTR|nr:hypothetical protein [Portunus trituberculatus]